MEDISKMTNAADKERPESLTTGDLADGTRFEFVLPITANVVNIALPAHKANLEFTRGADGVVTLTRAGHWEGTTGTDPSDTIVEYALEKAEEMMRLHSGA